MGEVAVLLDDFDPNGLDLDWPSYLYAGNTAHRALVDYEDYLWFIQWQWRFKKSRNSHKGYLFRTVKVKVGSVWVSQNQWLHAAIMARIEPPPRPGMVPDHIDRDTMNNTRANLRWATLSQNRLNR